ncbi:MAG: aminofutalosine synthase MqnE [Bacteroidales bacterium]|nr:aminofutalosine synthase MqnE [Bacteroidales bacterium]
MLQKRIKKILKTVDLSSTEKIISEKILQGERLTIEEGLFLYQNSSLHFLGLLANFVKQKINGKKVFFNKNFHLEPTNICIYNCKFCSYKRRFGDSDAWDYSIEQMLELCSKYKNTDVTEVHITGGVHPHYNVLNYCTLIKKIKQILPNIHIKAFTAVEIDYMCKKARMSTQEGLLKLKECGLNSLPGGGAEIFNEEIRNLVCDEKSSAKLWLNIHRTAHKIGIPSNATMLYGHLENYEHRIEHLNMLRDLQDETKGFNAFIPLKFRNFNNKLSHVPEVSTIEDMRNYAVSRLFLDNIPHIKAYWVMLGRSHAQMALAYGVDDLDGTIDDSTKIYTMAGVAERSPRMSSVEMVNLIKAANLIPVERDSIYNELNIFK